jgi:murein DD-endopeptidase MepM/ murein hydrolase activator NlpD
MAGLDSSITGSLYDFPLPGEYRSHSDSPTAFKRTQPVSSPFPEGLPVNGWVSRGYSAASGKRHDGIDIAIPEGTPVLATGAGVVKTAGHDDIYGEMILVQNNDSIETIYGHNSRLLVKTGDSIIAGFQVALSGNTGKSSAPHLHYEIRVHGKPINPLTYSGYETNTQ